MYKCVRVADSEYELRRDDGSVVTTYNKTKMTHPSAWISDAVNDGADGWAISSGEWEYIDER